MVDYQIDVSPDCSFLEMLDLLNEGLIRKGEEPVAFDYDCREGICGTCGLMVNGLAHGPVKGATICQVHMRSFKDGDQIYIEPWRAKAFPVVKDLVCDRSAFDRIIQAGGFVNVNTGGAPDGKTSDQLCAPYTADLAVKRPTMLQRACEIFKLSALYGKYKGGPINNSRELYTFRASLDAYDRHELVLLSSAYGLPVTGRQ